MRWPALRLLSPPARQPYPTPADAARLWPESAELQRRWLRAVAVVRATRRGWLLDQPTPRVRGNT
ncbi:MAG: hypothetical protein LC098_00105 [Burkholderiales bacterium]|nr:hypothetical protein [Burkholderiales bacterium]